MTTPTLPVELCYRVIQLSSDKVGLCSLALCCTSFRDEAQSELFRGPFLATTQQDCQFIASILSSPTRLGRMVRTYSVNNADHPSVEDVAAALRSMRNLKNLYVQAEQQTRVSTLFVTHYAFQLHIFTLNPIATGIVPATVFGFLYEQPALQRLTIYDHASEIRVNSFRDDPAWCPNLRYVTGGDVALKVGLGSKRPVRWLNWFNTIQSAPIITSSGLSTVVHFECTVYCDGEQDFSIFRHMTLLLHMDLKFLLEGNDNAHVQQLTFLTSVPPRLRYLSIWTVPPDYPNTERQSFVDTSKTARL
ncbi:hypothetical protein D9619_007578 [Psilocybe cf. subviscida]|uniref:F-box domain-containing protein n=1 Tax=Psilocybe cf. subviscida TaxID=2480587 RepID=A0A8H5B1D9_9AGAR|nr:hypothetical protein D9619_007578 [Psilocybe cf. subviscida]